MLTEAEKGGNCWNSHSDETKSALYRNFGLRETWILKITKRTYSLCKKDKKNMFGIMISQSSAGLAVKLHFCLFGSGSLSGLLLNRETHWPSLMT